MVSFKALEVLNHIGMAAFACQIKSSLARAITYRRVGSVFEKGLDHIQISNKRTSMQECPTIAIPPCIHIKAHADKTPHHIGTADREQERVG
jgi:hypothetical protein